MTIHHGRIFAPIIPLEEWQTLTPLFDVRTMLELGNKANPRGTYKSVFEAIGITHTSVDWNGQDGALPRDLREPLRLGVFDMVTNIGTTEHVEPDVASWEADCDAQHNAWRNIVEAAGRFIVSVTPVPGNWRGHGVFYPPAGFYHQLADWNGFEVERLDERGSPGRRLNYARLRRAGAHAERPVFRFPGIARAPG